MPGNTPEPPDEQNPYSDYPLAADLGPAQGSHAPNHANPPQSNPPIDPYNTPHLQQTRADGAIVALVLSILAWVTGCSFFLSIPAVIIAHNSMRKIDADPRLEGRDMCVAALVIGYINIGLTCVGFSCFGLYILMMAGVLAAAGP